jgi:hypothetical protein
MGFSLLNLEIHIIKYNNILHIIKYNNILHIINDRIIFRTRQKLFLLKAQFLSEK